MYNETYKQLLETLAGIYRSYYELVEWKEEYRNKVHVVIVADGYDRLSKDFLLKLEKAGIYNSFATSDYKEAEISSDKKDYTIKYKSRI